MSHGNPKKNTGPGMDAFIERLNQKIARLLGKKSKHPLAPPDKTSDGGFALIVFVVALLLWGVTGFYYLGENQSGVILTNGSITDVVKGIKVGFVWPYPFGNIEIIDTNISNLLKISKDDIGSDGYVVLSNDLVPIKIDAKFSYQVTNPQLLFLNVLQKNDNLDEMVRFAIWQKLHAYISHNSQNNVARDNLTVMAGLVRDDANIRLANSGIKVVKLEINSLSYPNNNVNETNEEAAIDQTESNAAVAVNANISSNQPAIVVQLLMEANKYKDDIYTQTKVNIDKFNQLLPEYKRDPDGIAEQMYFDMLAFVPRHSPNQYQLLNLGLPDLLGMAKQGLESTVSQNVSVEGRELSRTVDRTRNLDGRK